MILRIDQCLNLHVVTSIDTQHSSMYTFFFFFVSSQARIFQSLKIIKYLANPISSFLFVNHLIFLYSFLNLDLERIKVGFYQQKLQQDVKGYLELHTRIWLLKIYKHLQII